MLKNFLLPRVQWNIPFTLRECIYAIGFTTLHSYKHDFYMWYDSASLLCKYPIVEGRFCLIQRAPSHSAQCLNMAILHQTGPWNDSESKVPFRASMPNISGRNFLAQRFVNFLSTFCFIWMETRKMVCLFLEFTSSSVLKAFTSFEVWLMFASTCWRCLYDEYSFL